MVGYAITDPRYFDKNNPSAYLTKAKAKGASWLLYRDKSNFEYMYDARKVLQAAIDTGFERIIVHRDIWLAHRLEAGSVHLTSKQFNEIERAKELNLFTIVSTHSLDEALDAQHRGADAVTIGPLFATQDKEHILGIEATKEVVEHLDITVFALGGITNDERVDTVKKIGADGFASIRYFI